MNRFVGILFMAIAISSFGQTEKSKLLLFNGVYETKCRFEEGDDEGSQDYFRFYSNGKVINASTDCEGTALELKDWFNISAEQVSTGNYKINGRRIKFSTKSKSGTINYKGRIINHELIKLKWKSLINGNRGSGRYKFIKVKDLS